MSPDACPGQSCAGLGMLPSKGRTSTVPSPARTLALRAVAQGCEQRRLIPSFFFLSPRFSGSKPLQKHPCSLLSSFLNSTHSLLFLLWDSICCDALSAPSIATKPLSFDSCPQLWGPARSSMVQGPCCASPCTLVRSLHHDPSSPTSDGFWGRGEQSCPSRHGLLVPSRVTTTPRWGGNSLAWSPRAPLGHRQDPLGVQANPKSALFSLPGLGLASSRRSVVLV